MGGEDIPKYCEPTPEKISKEMEHVGLAPVFPETDKRTRAKLKNHPDWEEWKAYEFSQLDAIDKENMFGTPCRRPPRDTVLRKVWMYVLSLVLVTVTR